MTDKLLNTNQIMRQVSYALALGIGAQVYFFGLSVLIQILLACITGLIVEAIFLRLRGSKIKPAIIDGSVVLTAVSFERGPKLVDPKARRPLFHQPRSRSLPFQEA